MQVEPGTRGPYTMSSTPQDGSRSPRRASGEVSTQARVDLHRTRTRQELLWAVLENLSEGVVACDAGGTLSFFNRATREFHGLDEESIPMAEWSERYSLCRADGSPMAVDEVPLVRALRGEMVRDAVIVIAPHGRPARTVICTGRPLYDGRKKLLGAVVVMRDISEEIAAQRQKADLARERELNQAKDELLATVSHELRNPLTSILGWTQLLERQIEDDELRRTLSSIAASARMQAQLIDDLSDGARIAEGKLRLTRERLPVQEILEAVVDGSRPSADAKGIRLDVPARFDAAMVQADRLRLQQVFWNLLANSLKFTPDGGVVRVRMHVGLDQVQIDVTDTGRGIGADFLPRVFDRYAQESSVKSQHHGLGLGLSIARAIVELHGGAISVASAGEGRGATFTVKLPLAEVSS